MDKTIDIRDLQLLKKTISILDILNKDYDYKMLKEHPEICREIVALFEDELEYTLQER